MALTEEQTNFLEHPPTKSARVLAGPGTGKTFTSVAYVQKVTTDNTALRVGYVTFTRAATAEFAKKINDGGLAVIPKTMHGYSLGILLKNRSSSIPYPLRILDSWETKNIARPDITARLRAKNFTDITPTTVGELEREMAAGFETLGQIRLPLAESNPELVNAYKGVWYAHRNQYGYTLLSELPYQAGRVLEDIDDGDIDLDLLIVDEYQDLNQADQKVLIEIARRGVAIVSIGDDDQSIYSWRNAAPDGIRNFLSTFNSECDYPLTISMRCGGKALEVASNLIELDPRRQRKPRLSSSPSANNTAFHYLKFRSNIGEAKGVARIIAARIAEGVSPNDIGILVRSSLPAWVHNLRTEFEKAGIPIGEVANIDDILGSHAVRKAIGMAQLLINQEDSIAWRALLKITPGIGPSFVSTIIASEYTGSFAEKLVSAYINGFPSRAGVNQATILMTEITEWLNDTDLENVSLDSNGWGEWLIQQVGETEFTEDAKILLRAVGAQIGTSELLARFLSEFEPMAREIISGANEGVRMMSMSHSKGLTLNTVIVLGVEDGNIPAPRGIGDEELRLLYVALTRATHMTVVTYANRRKGPTARVGRPNVWVQQEQSPYMRALPDITLEDGDSFMT
jgi:DNA helicase-2/ATP-dependent DNA helicase PcrA